MLVGSFESIYSGDEQNAEPDHERIWAEGERSFDTHSMVALLRAWNPPRGTRGWFDARAGTITFRDDVVAARRELLPTRDGKLPAVRIEAAAAVTVCGSPPSRGHAPALHPFGTNAEFGASANFVVSRLRRRAPKTNFAVT